MFMAILDVQIVATSVTDDPVRELAISPDAMSWIQTAYLIAGGDCDLRTGLFTRVLTLWGLFMRWQQSRWFHAVASVG